MLLESSGFLRPLLIVRGHGGGLAWILDEWQRSWVQIDLWIQGFETSHQATMGAKEVDGEDANDECCER